MIYNVHSVGAWRRMPLVLNDKDSVVQYYVPYLSGIQIYSQNVKPTVKSRYIACFGPAQMIQFSDCLKRCKIQIQAKQSGLSGYFALF